MAVPSDILTVMVPAYNASAHRESGRFPSTLTDISETWAFRARACERVKFKLHE